MDEEVKVCRICTQPKPLKDFARRGKDGKRRSECKDCKRDIDREYQLGYRATPHHKSYRASWRAKNAKRIRAYNREWLNRPESRERKRARDRKDYETRRQSLTLRLHYNFSRRINASLRGQGNTNWEKLIGYSLKQLKAHLESLFAPGMSWKNYGEWHIDHTRPVSTFYFSDYDCPDFKACWALSNLQPLWGVDNCSKKNNWQPT